MSIEDLSEERKEILRKLSELSNDDLKAIDKLIERHVDILKVLRNDEAWAIVFTRIKTVAVWITIVIGVIYMGLDKFSIFVRGLIT